MIGLCPVCCVYVEIMLSLLVFFPSASLGVLPWECFLGGTFGPRSVREGEEGATLFIFADFDVVDGEGLVGVAVRTLP
jgi:hypothetical protein